MIAKTLRGSFVASLVCASAAATAQAQSTYTPLTFGPIGPAPVGQYYNSTLDISDDGLSVLATTNTGERRLVLTTTSYSFSGVGTPLAITPDGQQLVGGQSGSNPQRWRVSNVVSNNIASETITWPGGPLALGPAYGSNASGSASVLLSPTVSVVGDFGRVQASTAFAGGSVGAFRGMAATAPIVGILGSMPGNPTNAYRWNYTTNALAPLNMPAGASSIGLSTSATVMSSDGSIMVGSATFGIPTRPYWWDASGTPHEVPLLPGALSASAITTNALGSLVGGAMTVSPGVNHAYILSLADNRVYDLHQIYSAAGILPNGWTLVLTQAISADGSRVFCLATDNTGTQRAIVVDGNYNVPAPGAAALLAAAGVLATRRMRR